MTLDAIIAIPVGIVLLLMAVTTLSLRRIREYPAQRLGPSSQTGEVPEVLGEDTRPGDPAGELLSVSAAKRMC